MENYGAASVVAVKRYLEYRWTNGKLKYKAMHTHINTTTATKDWEIWKYTEDGSQWEGPRHGAVASEAACNALAWNI